MFTHDQLTKRSVPPFYVPWTGVILAVYAVSFGIGLALIQLFGNQQFKDEMLKTAAILATLAASAVAASLGVLTSVDHFTGRVLSVHEDITDEGLVIEVQCFEDVGTGLRPYRHQDLRQECLGESVGEDSPLPVASLVSAGPSMWADGLIGSYRRLTIFKLTGTCPRVGDIVRYRNRVLRSLTIIRLTCAG